MIEPHNSAEIFDLLNMTGLKMIEVAVKIEAHRLLVIPADVSLASYRVDAIIGCHRLNRSA